MDKENWSVEVLPKGSLLTTAKIIRKIMKTLRNIAVGFVQLFIHSLQDIKILAEKKKKK